MNGSLVIWLTSIFLSFNWYMAEAQPVVKNLPRIGIVSSTGGPSDRSPEFEALKRGLSELGYIDGTNVSFERRFAEGNLQRVPALVNEIVQQKVDVIFATNNAVIRESKQATKTIPIVMISSIDPIAAGYVASFARPGANMTGLAWLNRDISAKRIELLKELFPKLSRLGILWDQDGPGPAVAFKEYTTAARAFKIHLQSFGVRAPSPDLKAVFQAAKTKRLDAMIVVTSPLMGQLRKTIFETALESHIASMTENGRDVEAGGLISYGANLADLYRQGAEYVAAILKGAKPADLPVKLASKFETFVNLKTAKQLGIMVPQQVLLQADKVIQ